MNIHEYQAKHGLKKYGMPVSNGIIILKLEDIEKTINSFEAPLYVVKAQIHAGGRGKAGGVKICKTKQDAIEAAKKMWGMQLITHQTGPAGQKVSRIYIESGCDIQKEYYFSAVLDRSSSSVTFMASTEGGVDIEEVAAHSPEKIIKFSVDQASGLQAFHSRKLNFAFGFKDDVAKQMQKIVEAAYNAFIGTDANQIEINPLVLTKDNKLLALDAKMNFDDNALFRQPEIQAMRDESEEEPLEVKAVSLGLSYVKMEGNIGCLVNGAGLAMSTMDIIKLYGGEPANFLDVGGGANKEKVTEAFKIILSDKNVKAILVNIFGGIMRCDIIAEGIIAAAKEVGLSIPLVVRLAGTNFELGKQILDNSGLALISADDLADAAGKVVKSIS